MFLLLRKKITNPIIFYFKVKGEENTDSLNCIISMINEQNQSCFIRSNRRFMKKIISEQLHVEDFFSTDLLLFSKIFQVS